MTLHFDLRGRVGTRALHAALTLDSSPWVLAGPNGAGKTSLLLMLLGIVRPFEGVITLADRCLFDSRQVIDIPTERRQIAYMPQDFALFPHLTALGNVCFALACHDRHLRRSLRQTRALQILGDLDISDLAARYPATLSGGERQRVALARALATQPRALLLDEPLAALDIGARRQVRDFLLATLTRLGLPALIVTHDPADAMFLSDHIAIMESGAITQVGTRAELAAQPASPFVAEFVGAGIQ